MLPHATPRRARVDKPFHLWSVVGACVQLGEPSIQIPANALKDELWVEREQLGGSPKRAGADNRPWGEHGQIGKPRPCTCKWESALRCVDDDQPVAEVGTKDDGIAWVLALADGPNREAWWQGCWEVLQRVDNEVDIARHQENFELASEKVFRADLGESNVKHLVADCLEGVQLSSPD